MKKKHLYATVILLSFLAAGIQPAIAIDIPTNNSVGSWDPDARIYTLTQDVAEGLNIVEGSLTLDGAGYTVTPGLDEGVDIDQGSGIIVKNLRVFEGGVGISLRFCDNCTISNNTLDKCQYGIWLAGSNDNLVTGNTADQSLNAGIWLQQNAGYNNIIGNTTRNSTNGYGIYAQDCTNNNDLTNNTITDNEVGIGLFNCSNFSGSIAGNTISSNIQTNDAYAILLSNSDNNNLRNNTLSGNYRGLRIKVGSDNNLIYNNNFINTVGLHASVTDSTGNVFNLGEPIGGNYWDDYGGTGVYKNDYGVLDEYPWADQDGWVTNEPPAAHAGPDQIVECAYQTPEGTQVTLDGTGSSDPDSDPLTSYTWTGLFVEGGGTVTGATPTVTLIGCQPAYVITLVVNDGQVDSEPDTVTISVVDTTPPEISCPGDTTIVGPDGVPVDDERIQTFLDGASATDNCDPDPTITHNAPDVFPPGDTVVTFTATDASGNSSTCQSTVRIVDTEGNLCIIPSIINREGRLQQILAVIRFPEGTTVEDIDIDQPLILYPGDSPHGIEAISQRIVTWYSFGILRVSVFACFSKDEVTADVTDGPVEIMVIGRFDDSADGEYFYGFDNVWIISWNW
ncbi:MAG: right-handed parallel beta-helix repeat-containing protein [Phycisphaerae bacterium]|nr:right-handed parallel beta-helix repeat-containing protein [Phycisphaerae bacterium]